MGVHVAPYVDGDIRIEIDPGLVFSLSPKDARALARKLVVYAQVGEVIKTAGRGPHPGTEVPQA